MDQPPQDPGSPPFPHPVSGPSPAGARCAVHPTAAAVRVCTRCGDYVCASCAADASGLCTGCRARLGAEGFPLRRDTWTVETLLSLCFDAWKRHWPLLTLVTLVWFAIILGVGFLRGALQAGIGLAIDPVVGAVVGLFLFVGELAVQWILQLGVFRVSLDILLGKPVSLGTLFGQYKKLLRVALQQITIMAGLLVPLAVYGGVLVALAILIGGGGDIERTLQSPVGIAVIGLGALPLVPALFYVGLGLSQAQVELAHDDAAGPIRSILHAWELARGERLRMFVVLLLAGLAYVVGMFGLCIGVLFTAGLGQLLMAGLYLSLRNGAALPRAERH